MINLILKEQVPGFKFIAVNFVGSHVTYTYKTTLDIKVGDLVVIESPSGLKVVTVADDDVEVKPSPKYAIKWVVCKVPTLPYNFLRTTENRLLAEQQEAGVNRL